MTTILAWLRLDKNSSTPARCWTLGAGRVHGKRLAKAEGRRRRRVAGHDSGAREGEDTWCVPRPSSALSTGPVARRTGRGRRCRAGAAAGRSWAHNAERRVWGAFHATSGAGPRVVSRPAPAPPASLPGRSWGARGIERGGKGAARFRLHSQDSVLRSESSWPHVLTSSSSLGGRMRQVAASALRLPRRPLRAASPAVIEPWTKWWSGEPMPVRRRGRAVAPWPYRRLTNAKDKCGCAKALECWNAGALSPHFASPWAASPLPPPPLPPGPRSGLALPTHPQPSLRCNPSLPCQRARELVVSPCLHVSSKARHCFPSRNGTRIATLVAVGCIRPSVSITH